MAPLKFGFRRLNRPPRPLVGVFGVAFCMAVLLGLYQNCAPSGSINPAASTSEGDQDHIVRALEGDGDSDESSGETNATSSDARAITSKAEVSSNPDRDCAFSKLRCFRKIYSPVVDDASGLETLCLDSNDPASCLTVSTNSYNTRHSVSTCTNCRPEDVRPGGEYNREEFTCWMGDPNSPTTSVFALRSTFSEAVIATRALCGAQ